MDVMVANIIDYFTPHEIAVQDGLGYEMPHHSCDAIQSSKASPTGGGAVICEEAWNRFLQSRENNKRRTSINAKTEEARKHELVATHERFCTQKLLAPGFATGLAKLDV